MDVVGRCIESVVSQDFTDLELVISDNASDDGTSTLLPEYARADRRVRTSVNEMNIGLHENMNRVLEFSRGEFFRWISADDWLEPGCLSACVRGLRAREDAIGVTTYFTIHTVGRGDQVRGVPGGIPDVLRPCAAIRAHAVVLPCRRRQIRSDLRHVPAGRAHALPSPPSHRSRPTGSFAPSSRSWGRSSTWTSVLRTGRAPTP